VVPILVPFCQYGLYPVTLKTLSVRSCPRKVCSGLLWFHWAAQNYLVPLVGLAIRRRLKGWWDILPYYLPAKTFAHAASLCGYR